jgi:mRNA deadenylase 3'-5' endonuclease subunit Ccr4
MAFTLATWNILANAYIRPEYYPRTPAQILDPMWRIPAVVRRAKEIDADVLCLQEVEAEVLAPLENELGGVGYLGRYARKGGHRPDGCATFVRRFKLVADRRVVFAGGSGHVAQLVYLELEGQRLMVLNTHLKWDPPDTPRERQWSYRQIVECLDLLRSERGSTDGQIVCGDFNVVADSDVVGALQAAGFEYAHRDFPAIHTCNSNGEAKLIDYLFHSDSLRAKPLLPPPIDGQTALPSAEQPSDHLPLIAEFDWPESAYPTY